MQASSCCMNRRIAHQVYIENSTDAVRPHTVPSTICVVKWTRELKNWKQISSRSSQKPAVEHLQVLKKKIPKEDDTDIYQTEYPDINIPCWKRIEFHSTCAILSRNSWRRKINRRWWQNADMKHSRHTSTKGYSYVLYCIHSCQPTSINNSQPAKSPDDWRCLFI